MLLTEEHIKNQFIVNPEWKQLFYKHYKDFTSENYIKRTQKILELNGYHIEYENRYKSDKFKCIVCPCLYKGNKFIIGKEGHESNAIEQLMIMIICDYEIDFSKLK